MSDFYKPRRSWGLYNPKTRDPFKLSRSKIDLFLECPLCFYLDRRLGVGRPPGFPFNLNSAVDKLLKKEFDLHRAAGSAHPLMSAYGLKAKPFQHDLMEKWRDAFKRGIDTLDKETNFIIGGGIDDVWINDQNELIIVDYKATAKDSEVNLDAEWQIGYKRQVEVYQWLFRQNDFKVSDTAYFVYCNGKTDREAFDAKLEFDIKLIPYEGNTDWIPNTLKEAKTCLDNDQPPKSNPACDYCSYRKAISEVGRELAEKSAPPPKKIITETTPEKFKAIPKSKRTKKEILDSNGSLF